MRTQAEFVVMPKTRVGCYLHTSVNDTPCTCDECGGGVSYPYAYVNADDAASAVDRARTIFAHKFSIHTELHAHTIIPSRTFGKRI